MGKAVANLEAILTANEPTGRPDLVIEKLKDMMGLLETRMQELEKCIEAATTT